MSNSIMVVADLYQLSRADGDKFENDISIAKKKRSGSVIERAYAERINKQWMITGKKWNIDEEATIKWKKEVDKDTENRKAQDQFNKLNNTSALSDALKTLASANQQPQPNAVEQIAPSEVKPDETWEVPKIQAWLTLKDIEFHHKNGKETLLELVK